MKLKSKIEEYTLEHNGVEMELSIENGKLITLEIDLSQDTAVEYRLERTYRPKELSFLADLMQKLRKDHKDIL